MANNDGQFKIYKTDDKRQVFGWANVAIRTNGEQIIDWQGDMFDPEDLEESAYNYVLKFRDTGEEHIGDLRKKGKLIESVVFTKEKMQAMGIPEGIVPEGWWIGFKIYDDDAWEKIKDGTYKMFSIEGAGIREKVEDIGKSEKLGNSFTFGEFIEKFNPHHDRLGRFSTADGGVSFTIRTKDPSKQYLVDRAIAREKERTAAMAAASKKPSEKGDLVRGLGQEHVDNMEKLVADAPEFIQNVWNKYGDQIYVADANSRRGYCNSTGGIAVNIKKDSAGSDLREPYETTMHESGHSIDHAIKMKIQPDHFDSGYYHDSWEFARDFKDGIFEKTIIKEVKAYEKAVQKRLETDFSERTGRKQKVTLAQAREEISRELCKMSFKESGTVSDMFEGATKGKIHGTGGHGKQYWSDRNVRVTYDTTVKVRGVSVATEAFAEMFSATITNPKGLTQIKKYFPESYKVFEGMLGEV